MMTLNQVILMLAFLIIASSSLTLSQEAAKNVFSNHDRCFCQLEGQIDDCFCDIDTVDHFNNMKIFPRLQSLLQKPYFKYFRYNAKKKCPFWNNEAEKCRNKNCGVKSCSPEEIPSGLAGSSQSLNEHDNEPPHLKYAKDAQDVICNGDKMEESNYEELDSSVDDRISDAARASLEKWRKHDENQRQFCEVDGEICPDCDYVDLTLNPERFTGYSGEAAHRIWRAIYEENCFSPPPGKLAGKISSKTDFSSAFLANTLEEMCLEKRAFYRAVSGLHSSITIHLCANYLMSKDQAPAFLTNVGDQFGPNLPEFLSRFDPDVTNGQGPYWLKNLYFVYLLELRALYKVSSFLENQPFFTGIPEEDKETQIAVKELLNIIKSFPNHFDESAMFSGSSKELREEFRIHFLNVSRIMDCVSCDKCKLWGKLQITGLGTALKILFNQDIHERDISDAISENESSQLENYPFVSEDFRLSRNEIVALFNAFGRISTSVRQLEKFRQMIKEEKGTKGFPGL